LIGQEGVNGFKDRVRWLRKKRGLTYKALSVELKEFVELKGYKVRSTSVDVLSGLEQGAPSPSMSLLIVLSEYYEVTIDWLLKGVESNTYALRGVEDEFARNIAEEKRMYRENLTKIVRELDGLSKIIKSEIFTR